MSQPAVGRGRENTRQGWVGRLTLPCADASHGRNFDDTMLKAFPLASQDPVTPEAAVSADRISYPRQTNRGIGDKGHRKSRLVAGTNSTRARAGVWRREARTEERGLERFAPPWDPC